MPGVIRPISIWTPQFIPSVRRARKPPVVKPPPVTPFFKLPEHRIPTIRLYRSLLRATRPKRHAHPELAEGEAGPGPSTLAARESPSQAQQATTLKQHPFLKGKTHRRRPLEGVRRELIYTWHRARRLVSPSPVRLFLTRQYALLSLLQSEPIPPSLIRLNRHILSLHLPRRPKARFPRLTGHWIPPTLFNPPIPRMRPQPPHVTMLIVSRIKRRSARIAQQRQAEEWYSDWQHEVAFWRSCGEQALEGGWRGWDVAEMVRDRQARNAAYEAETRRSQMKVSEKDWLRVDKYRKRRMNAVRLRNEKRNRAKREAKEQAERERQESAGQ